MARSVRRTTRSRARAIRRALARPALGAHRATLLVTAAAVALVALLLVPPGIASAHHTTVTGEVECASDGTYIVHWSAVNSQNNSAIVELTATLSEAASGTVVMSPIPVPASGTATGTSTHPGTTTGRVKLTVDARWDTGHTSTDKGNVTLSGDCSPGTGKILIHKVTFDPNGSLISEGAGFSFSLSGTASDSGSTDSAQTLMFSDLPAGSYNINEVGFAAGSWTNLGGEIEGVIVPVALTSTSCATTPPSGLPTSLDVQVGAGETVQVCWYNRQIEEQPPGGKILVQKVILNEFEQQSRGGAGFVFDVAYYAGNGAPPPDQTLVTDSGGMGMSIFKPGAWIVTETNSQGLQDLGGFAIGGFSIGDEVDPFEVCTSPYEYTYSQDYSIDNGSISSYGSSIVENGDGVHVYLGDGELVIVCWYNFGDQPPPPPPPPPPTTVELTIVKRVTADAGADAPAAGTSFEFALDCIGTDATFSLADGQSHKVTFSGATQCSLTETNTQGADSVSGEFSNELISSNRTVTVVNHYEGVAVLGSSIVKVLTSANPAAIGERVSFDVTVSFTGTLLANAEFVDVYENEFLSFEGATSGFATVACQHFPGMPNAAHDMVVCPAGDLTGPATLTLHFTALKGTLGDATLNEAKVVSDPDGPGGTPPLIIGPAFDDVEVVEVLALPPLGDGPASPAGAPLALALALTALTLAGAAAARRLVREEGHA